MAGNKNVNRPRHPFKYLEKGQTNPKNKIILHNNITPAQKKILYHLKKGARLIFDIKQKRGLVYNFAKGVNKILEITTRMISDLIKLGYIKVAGVEDKIIHYVWVGDSLEWFLPEKH